MARTSSIPARTSNVLVYCLSSKLCSLGALVVFASSEAATAQNHNIRVDVYLPWKPPGRSLHSMTSWTPDVPSPVPNPSPKRGSQIKRVRRDQTGPKDKQDSMQHNYALRVLEKPCISDNICGRSSIYLSLNDLNQVRCAAPKNTRDRSMRSSSPRLHKPQHRQFTREVALCLTSSMPHARKILASHPRYRLCALPLRHR
jgi:hypothetical protein